MINFLEPRASDRKLRLFGVACCRRALHLSDDPRHRATIDAAERFALGQIEVAEWRAAEAPIVALWAEITEAQDWSPGRYMTAATRHLDRGVEYAADFVSRGLAVAAGLKAPDDPDEPSDPAWLEFNDAEALIQADIIRDLFGDPFEPFAFDPAWLAGPGRDAVALARRIDEAGDFKDLRGLAVTLEAAGCLDHAVLNHCRGPGPHHRGCWVVDALLGREPAVALGLQTEADWRSCPDPTSLLRFLRDRGTERRWRRFAVACCRRIENWITDERSRGAVDVADRFCDALATSEELAAAREEAREACDEARHAEWSAEAEANFRITSEYAAVSRALFAAEAARGTVNRDPRESDDAPQTFEARCWKPTQGWATAAIRWHIFASEPTVLADPMEFDANRPLENFPLVMTEHGKLTNGPLRFDAQRAAEVAQRAERLAQRDMLLDIFGDLIGPTGSEWAWMPAGQAAAVAEWWCRLPTPISVEVLAEWLDADGGAGRRLARAIHETGAFSRLPELADLLEGAGCAEAAILDHLRGPGPHVRGCWVLDRLLGFGPATVASAPWDAA